VGRHLGCLTADPAFDLRVVGLVHLATRRVIAPEIDRLFLLDAIEAVLDQLARYPEQLDRVGLRDPRLYDARP
jgi:hypothetical protein